ncbi:MAG TPA: serine/threonine-protein kinase [Myxococcaceae bacterium]|nr:serine/threonine-protein kinase [Myxococcaceae bacterium]
MEWNQKAVRPEELPPGTEVESWRVVERLGVGGYGAVYRAEHRERPGDFCALKVALRPVDARAEREAVLLLNRAVHPNVVRFHACFRWPLPHQGFLCILMDWVPGLPLHLWADSLNPSFRELADVGRKVALALAFLHSRDVLHRDLKPEHIILRSSDGEPVLLDLGAGWYEGADTLTHSPLPPGTLHLRSPEAIRFLLASRNHPGTQYHCAPTDDLYALGVCLYRAATGHYPFSPDDFDEPLRYRIAYLQPLAPSALNPRVPRALSELILRLLSKRPEERWQTGEALAEALVAAAALGRPKDWEASIFEWEELPPEKEGDAPPRRIRRPEWPRQPELLSAPRANVRPSPAARVPRRRRREQPQEAPPQAPPRKARRVALVAGAMLMLGVALP